MLQQEECRCGDHRMACRTLMGWAPDQGGIDSDIACPPLATAGGFLKT